MNDNWPLYRCEECGSVFNKPDEWTEDYGQKFIGSPCCHTNFEEVNYCVCGNLKKPSKEFCKQCEEAIEVDNERVRDIA